MVAWGDSLTANPLYTSGIGALFSPAKSIANRGVGGQTSTQIACRQGGLPLQVTVTGDQLTGFNETLVHDFDFTNSNLNGFVVAGVGATVTATAAGMLIQGVNVDTGARLLSGVNLPAGRYKTVATCVDPSSALRIQSRTGANANAGDIGQTASGEIGFQGTTTAAGSRINIIGSANETGTGALTVQRLRVWSIDATPTTTVTAKTINVLVNSGTFTGRLDGTLGGVQVYVTTDAAGAWTVQRLAAGATVAVAAGSVLTLSEAVAFKARTALIWVGRNGPQAGYTIAGDRAALVANVGHSRFLIIGEITASTDNMGSVAAILARNASDAATYGYRFVDILAPLLAAGDGSAGDTADIAAGIVPRSLRSDAIHLNAAGYVVISPVIFAAFRANGFR